MPGARILARLVVLVSLAAGLAGCGEPPDHAQSYGTERASPLPAGIDTMTGLQQRPIRPPALSPDWICSVSSTADLGAVAPNYGVGEGPVYLSGQDSWYSGGQVAILMIDSRYSGPLLVRPFQFGQEGNSTVTLADFSSPNSGMEDKERQHGVAMVPALETTEGGLFIGAIAPSPFWRAAEGRLSTAGRGCFGLQVDGDVFTEFIVFVVKAGMPPPG